MKKLNKLSVCASVVMIISIAFFVVISPRASAGTRVGGIINTDTFWVSSGSPYWVESDVVVQSGANLTIEVGVDVLFNGYYSLYIEEGAVLWIDTWVNPRPFALFSSNFTVKNIGDWRAIQFNDSSYDHSSISDSVIEYATYGVRLESASPTIRNSTIRSCNYGIYSNYGFPTIENNTVIDCTVDGIHVVGDVILGGSANIKNNIIHNNTQHGIILNSVSYAGIRNNTIDYSTYGVYGSYSSSVVENNTVDNCTEDGIHIVGNNPNGIMGLENNDVYNNVKRGVVLYDVTGVRMRNNSIYNNSYNFGVWGDTLLEFIHDIDTTNTVDQNPMYYWINHEHDDETVPLDAGYVGIVNSTNITAENLTLTHNGQGVLVGYSDHINITNITATDNEVGVILYSSSNNTMENSNVSNNYYNIYYPGASGIFLYLSSGNIFKNNTGSWNGIGIFLWLSDNNTIFNNIIFKNSWGIWLLYSDKNNINNNTASMNGVGIRLFYSISNNIINNLLPSNTYEGIRFDNSDGNNIIDNNISSNRIGILLQFSGNNNITTNKITYNSYRGILLSQVSSNIISYCNISLNDYYGIYLAMGTSNDIHNNTISYNTQGIYCVSPSSPTITWNDIHNNTDAGVNCTSGSNPVIHYNNIEDNLKDLNDPQSGYGVNNQYPSIEVDATYNWWGDASGPYHSSNPTGQGNQVSDDVNFDYYSGQPY